MASEERVFAEVWKKTSTNRALAILLTGARAYVGDGDKIVVYDTVTRQEITECAPTGSYIWYISQSRDEKSLFVACDDETARVINLDTGKEVVLRGHTSAVRCIIRGEGNDALTCSYDKTIRRWNSSTGECLHIYKGHTDSVDSILYHEATKRIISASGDKTIIVWNGETGEKIRGMEGHGNWVRSLAQVNSTTFASGSWDGTIKLWDMATLTCIKTISNNSAVYSVVATPDGQYLISGSSDYNVKVWIVATGQCVRTISHCSFCVLKVAVSPDGRFVASGGYDNMFHLLSVTPPFSFAIREDVLVHDDREKSISLLSDGTIRSDGDVIATVTYSSTCSLTDTAQFVVKLESVTSVAFTAPSVAGAQLWNEAICAFISDREYHPDNRASSATETITRYRFDLLQTIVIHHRNSECRLCVSREIMQIVGGYL